MTNNPTSRRELQIRIKERVYRVSKETEEVYTPETIRELWSGDTADTCLVLALLEKWEAAEARLAATRRALENASNALTNLQAGRWEIGYVKESVDAVLKQARAALATAPATEEP